jgi:hypothetical protein
MVDADLAELVDNHGDAPSVLGRENAVQKRRFAGAEKSRQHGYGYALVLLFSHRVKA